MAYTVLFGSGFPSFVKRKILLLVPFIKAFTLFHMNHLLLQYFQGGTAFFHIFKNEFRKNDFEAATETFFSERLCFLE